MTGIPVTEDKADYIDEAAAMALLECERPAQLRGIREKYLASGYHYAKVRGLRTLRYHKGRLEEWQREQITKAFDEQPPAKLRSISGTAPAPASPIAGYSKRTLPRA